MSETLHTKWGIATINERGYYRITSRKEGNRNKYLHKLIWEAYNGKTPENMAIHHIDENKTNNRIDNLQLLSNSEHGTLHNKDRKGHPLSDETKQKISDALKGNKHTFKNYARITKNGFHRGKQRYAIRIDGKIIKQSVNKNNLLNWFEKTYPNENIIIEVGDA